MIGSAARFGPRNRQGHLLPGTSAVVELINILRPTVAASRLIVFAAHALDQHPAWRACLRNGTEAGTSHDPRLRNNPGSFRPDRFKTWSSGKIPVGLTQKTTLLLIQEDYMVPAQDLAFNLLAIPALTRNGAVLRPAPERQAR